MVLEDEASAVPLRAPRLLQEQLADPAPVSSAAARVSGNDEPAKRGGSFCLPTLLDPPPACPNSSLCVPPSTRRPQSPVLACKQTGGKGFAPAEMGACLSVLRCRRKKTAPPLSDANPRAGASSQPRPALQPVESPVQLQRRLILASDFDFVVEVLSCAPHFEKTAEKLRQAWTAATRLPDSCAACRRSLVSLIEYTARALALVPDSADLVEPSDLDRLAGVRQSQPSALKRG